MSRSAVLQTDLGSRVVKLSSLADGQPTRPQDENLLGPNHLSRVWGTRVGEVLQETLLHWEQSKKDQRFQ